MILICFSPLVIVTCDGLLYSHWSSFGKMKPEGPASSSVNPGLKKSGVPSSEAGVGVGLGAGAAVAVTGLGTACF